MSSATAGCVNSPNANVMRVGCHENHREPGCTAYSTPQANSAEPTRPHDAAEEDLDPLARFDIGEVAPLSPTPPLLPQTTRINALLSLGQQRPRCSPPEEDSGPIRRLSSSGRSYRTPQQVTDPRLPSSPTCCCCSSVSGLGGTTFDSVAGTRKNRTSGLR